jgi:hypothetical protein
MSFFFMLMTVSLSAQAVVVNSPESIAGSYTFAAAGFGRALDSVWTADVVFVDDGSANPTQGCMAPVNAAEIAGKIALIDRGTCEFGLKCLNAEQAGAIAVIVFNNAPGAGPIVMGAGVNGGAVTIPCVMLSYEDGQTIRGILATEPVNVSLGAIRFDNDLRITRTSVVNAPLGTIPGDQVEEDGDYFITPGARVTNVGINNASSVTVSATIEHTPFDGDAAEVYSETETVESLESDSATLILLPEFNPASTGKGVYVVDYVISSDSTDDTGADNAFSSQFVLSENAYSKAGWDLVNNRPRITTAYTIAGGGPIEFLAPFHINKGLGYTLDSVQLYTSIGAPATSLANTLIETYVYDWVDTNEDGTMNNDEMTVVAFGSHTFAEDFVGTASWITIPLIDLEEFEPSYIIPEDNKVYVVGVRYQGADLVFFGFDENYDLTEFINVKGATEDFTDADWPYIGINGWTDIQPDVDAGFLFTGLRASVSQALYVNKIETSVEDRKLGAETLQIKLFPNPANDYLVADVKLNAPTSYLEYHIFDANGRMLFSARNSGIAEDMATFNVSALPSGQYYLTVRTEQGHRSVPFIVN